ncbi:hypothetical protein Q2941_29435 [Bradyrhizobium sp. UFLA05-153]
MPGAWFFRYLDKHQNAKQSRFFSTREQAIMEAYSFNEKGYCITSLEGPGLRMTAVDLAKWFMDHRAQIRANVQHSRGSVG